MKKSYILMFRNGVLAMLVLMFTQGLFAQTNFSGSWAFNESKSNFGDSQFRFAATAMTVSQDANTLTVESTMLNRDGDEMKMSAKYALDGSVSENPMFNSTRKSTAAWSADKTSLTISSVMTFDMGGETREMKSTETWKLADGGKVLMLESVRPSRDGGEMKTMAAYDKK
jgi:hypothetical protein